MTNKPLPPGGKAVSPTPDYRGDRDYAQKVNDILKESWVWIAGCVTLVLVGFHLIIRGFLDDNMAVGTILAIMMWSPAFFMLRGAVNCARELMGEVRDLQNTLSRLTVYRSGRVAGDGGRDTGGHVPTANVVMITPPLNRKVIKGRIVISRKGTLPIE